MTGLKMIMSSEGANERPQNQLYWEGTYIYIYIYIYI